MPKFTKAQQAAYAARGAYMKVQSRYARKIPNFTIKPVKSILKRPSSLLSPFKLSTKRLVRFKEGTYTAAKRIQRFFKKKTGYRPLRDYYMSGAYKTMKY